MNKEMVFFPVIYNGKVDSYYSSDTASKLMKGCIYWVTKVCQHSWHTEYFLEGIESRLGFNAVWFEDVPTYEVKLCRGTIPIVGEKIERYKRRKLGEQEWVDMRLSTTIQAVHMISTKDFIVFTQNSRYNITL